MSESDSRKAKVETLLRGFPVVIQIPVAWGEMDSYRHVNNVVYFRYFENVRLEYFRRLDWFAYERETGIGPILAATQARFRRPLTYPDTVAAGVRVTGLAEDRFTMEYRLASHALGDIATEGQGTIVTIHYPTGKKVAIPDELRRRITDMEANPALGSAQDADDAGGSLCAGK
jgi:acyl-CoA thioester hydrolase